MTWFRFTRDYAYRDMRVTIKYAKDEVRNIPRAHALAAIRDKAGEEVKDIEKPRKNKTQIPAKDGG